MLIGDMVLPSVDSGNTEAAVIQGEAGVFGDILVRLTDGGIPARDQAAAAQCIHVKAANTENSLTGAKTAGKQVNGKAVNKGREPEAADRKEERTVEVHVNAEGRRNPARPEAVEISQDISEDKPVTGQAAEHKAPAGTVEEMLENNIFMVCLGLGLLDGTLHSEEPGRTPAEPGVNGADQNVDGRTVSSSDSGTETGALLRNGAIRQKPDREVAANESVSTARLQEAQALPGLDNKVVDRKISRHEPVRPEVKSEGASAEPAAGKNKFDSNPRPVLETGNYGRSAADKTAFVEGIDEPELKIVHQATVVLGEAAARHTGTQPAAVHEPSASRDAFQYSGMRGLQDSVNQGSRDADENRFFINETMPGSRVTLMKSASISSPSDTFSQTHQANIEARPAADVLSSAQQAEAGSLPQDRMQFQQSVLPAVSEGQDRAADKGAGQDENQLAKDAGGRDPETDLHKGLAVSAGPDKAAGFKDANPASSGKADRIDRHLNAENEQAADDGAGEIMPAWQSPSSVASSVIAAGGIGNPAVPPASASGVIGSFVDQAGKVEAAGADIQAASQTATGWIQETKSTGAVARQDAAGSGQDIVRHAARLSEVTQLFDRYVSIAVSKPNGSLSIGIEPENLGHITMTCREENGRMAVDIVVESGFVRSYLMSHENQLRQLAESSGFTVSQFNVRADSDARKGQDQAWRETDDGAFERNGDESGEKHSKERYVAVSQRKVLFVA